MEKFGLFELFAALAGAGKEAPGGKAEPQGGHAQEPPQGSAPQGVFTAEERRRRAQEALLRHEALSRRIGRGKK